MSYGESIGNHMGYYSSSLEILAESMPEQFSEKNVRVFRLVQKLQKMIASVNIRECYEDEFAKNQEKIKQNFQQLLSVLKIKSESDDPKKALEF